MNETIAIFEATNSDLSKDILKYGITTVVILVVLVAGYFKKVSYEQRNYKNMLLMLGFFAMLISAMSTFFSWLNTTKITPVVIKTSSISTPYGEIYYDDIHNAYIHTEEERSKLSRTKVVRRTKFLIIEDQRRRPHSLSEEDYPINKIFDALEKQVKTVNAK